MNVVMKVLAVMYLYIFSASFVTAFPPMLQVLLFLLANMTDPELVFPEVEPLAEEAKEEVRPRGPLKV